MTLWMDTVTVLFHIRLTSNESTKINVEIIIIYEVKLSIYDATYIGDTHQKIKKRKDVNFSDLMRLLKNGQK